MRMKTLSSASLGAWTFFASSHSADSCGLNGLPLTPNSIRILGRFQRLKTLIHPNLSLYLDIIRSKHERIIIVCEHYTACLRSERSDFSIEELAHVTFELIDALGYLHSKGIVHRMLSPDCILFSKEGHLKLSNYGLFDITEYGACVPFCIGVPKYMAPEVILMSSMIPDSTTKCAPTGSKCDIWSMGMILLEYALGKELWKECSLERIFRTILSLKKLENGVEIVKFIALQHMAEIKLKELNSSLLSFIESCLIYTPSKRPSAKQLISSDFLISHGFSEEKCAKAEDTTFPSIELRCQNLLVPKYIPPIIDHLSQCPLDIVYYLWQLAGGDVETELKRQGLIKPKPPICTLPNLVFQEGEEFGQKKGCAFLMNALVILLPLDQLRQRLKNLDPRIYYPLLEHSSVVESNSWANLIEETGSLPLVIREKDIEYQLHRTILYNRLLAGYPYKRPQIVREARKDIPPLYRAKIWASLLEIEGDVQQQYDAIDKETPTPTDRQIEVDIPRCHQYNEFLASPTGHNKFKRLLKAWVVSHPNYVYWQGLDSLCAPFLYLNFNDEALAYACLKAFIPKYLHNFFLKDNSPIIQEYLAVFSHLIAYHDPQLINHLDSIGFIPELYSIPWFLTMYTHVFPLHKIFHLWDTLLLGNGSFPLCIAVAILQQLRSNLLAFGFNECILLFSDMPDIDIERCVRDSIKIFCSTPKSTTFRQHAFGIESEVNNPLGMSPLSLEVLKSELASRISAEEFLELLDPKSATKIKLLVIDVRPNEEFSRGAVAESINIPFGSAFSSDGALSACSETTNLTSHKGKMTVVVGSHKNSHSSHFANQLVRLGYARVCTLHGGVEVLRSVTGALVIRTAV